MTNVGTQFKKGNTFSQMVKNAGRPEYWTIEKINEIIDALGEWVEKEDSVCLAGFRAQEGLTDNVIHLMKQKSSDFSKAYHMAQLRVANRLSNNVGKNVHVVHYNKYQSYYDSGLKEHEVDMIETRVKAETSAKKAQEDGDKEKIEAFMKLIERRQDDRKIDEKSSKTE